MKQIIELNDLENIQYTRPNIVNTGTIYISIPSSRVVVEYTSVSEICFYTHKLARDLIIHRTPTNYELAVNTIVINL